MSGFTLRPYQSVTMDRVRDALRRVRRVLMQSPTGSGKSVMIADMIYRSADRGLSSWLVCHRRELLQQLSDTLWEAGVEHGMIAAGRKMTRQPVQVCSIQTLVRRLDRVSAPDLLAIDEAHHASATTYQKIQRHCADSWVVGLTATPVRTDGRGLDDLFDELVEGPSVSWLMDNGHLARYRLVWPGRALNLEGVRSRGGDWSRTDLQEIVQQKSVVGDAVAHWKKYVGTLPGRPTCLVYCVSRAHARYVEERYRAAGIDARYCAGDTDAGERTRMIEGFRYGQPQVIVSVDLFGEGLDVPRLDAVQLLRPTQSLGLHLQQIGRALRPDGDKVALILDHVGNTWRHGLPDDERDWSLEGTRTKKDSGEAALSLRHCPECFAIYRANLRECPQCGHAPVVDPRDAMPDEVDGELEEVDVEQLRRERKMEEAQADTLEDLVKLAQSRGYKAAWAGIRHAARTGEPRKKCIAQAYRIWRKIA